LGDAVKEARGGGVRLAFMAEHDAKHVGLVAPAIRPDDRRSGAEVHLGLFAGTTFHPPKRNRGAPAQPPCKAFDVVVAALEPSLHQILEDSLSADSSLYLYRTRERLMLSNERRAAPASPPVYLELVATDARITHPKVVAEVDSP
jgi:hypothetical protein